MQKVQDVIAEEGGQSFRFNTDRYPGRDILSLGFGKGVPKRRLVSTEGELDLDTVSAIWYRRMRIGKNLPKGMDPQLAAPSNEESRRTFRGMMATSAPFVLDPLQNIRYAENKQLHALVARKAGLEVPDSLFTNDPGAVRRFADAHPDGIITKMQSSFAIYRDDEEQVVFTNKMTEADLSELDGLNLCPMIFQEMVPKKLELRVTVVGNEIFCAGIDSTTMERAESDWRKEGHAFAEHWKPYELPEAVKAGLLKTMDFLQLNYGAIDIILTPDDRYVFLEVNPCGEFYWLEMYADLPISKAIARLLTGKIPRRFTGGHVTVPASAR